MGTLLISAVASNALWSSSAQAGPNCILMITDQAMRDCFDRTFSTTPNAEPTIVPQNAKPASKLASSPKTQSASSR